MLVCCLTTQENHSPARAQLRDSSNFGGANYGSPVSMRGSPAKRLPSLPLLGEEALSPAVLRSLSITGRQALCLRTVQTLYPEHQCCPQALMSSSTAQVVLTS